MRHPLLLFTYLLLTYLSTNNNLQSPSLLIYIHTYLHTYLLTVISKGRAYLSIYIPTYKPIYLSTYLQTYIFTRRWVGGQMSFTLGSCGQESEHPWKWQTLVKWYCKLSKRAYCLLFFWWLLSDVCDPPIHHTYNLHLWKNHPATKVMEYM